MTVSDSDACNSASDWILLPKSVTSQSGKYLVREEREREREEKMMTSNEKKVISSRN
jgi:hypothetical protein